MFNYLRKYQIFELLRQVQVLTKANLAARYRKTVAGFIWVNMDPLITYGVQSTVFKYILHFNIRQFGLFLASGLLPWIFLMQTIRICTPIYEAKKDFLKTYKIRPVIILLSQLCDNLINFIFTTSLIMPILFVYHKVPLISIVFLPISLVLLTIGLFPMAWILAITHVFFKDTKYIITFIANIAYWVTPVFYPASYVPDNLKWCLWINPFYHYTNLFRSNVYNFDIQTYLKNAGQVLILDLFFILVAYFIWRKNKNGFYLNL